MRRREFIALVGGAALALPRVVCAQQPIPVIVFFNSGTPSTHVKNLAAFRNGLKEVGLVEGQNLAIEFVWAENRFEGLETLAAEVIARRPSVIVSNTLAAIRAKSSTTTIPIVFTTGSDPVRDGLVSSFNRPGGNVTGVVFISSAVGGKRLELLRKLVPKAGLIAMLVNPGTTETDAERAEVQAAAQAVGQQIRIFEIRNTAEIETAVAAAVAAGAGALLMGAGTFWFNNRLPIVEFGRSPRDSSDVLDARTCRGWRSNELWREHLRGLSPGRSVCRANSQGRKARRSPSDSVRQV